MQRWAVLFVVEGSELKVLDRLNRRPIPGLLQAICPTYTVKKNKSDILKALYPGYIFCSIETDVEGIRDTLGTFEGAHKVLDHYATDKEMKRVLAQDPGTAPEVQYAPGDMIRIIGGSCSKLSGEILFPKSRIDGTYQVKINLFGRDITTRVRPQDLELA